MIKIESLGISSKSYDDVMQGFRKRLAKQKIAGGDAVLLCLENYMKEEGLQFMEVKDV